MEDYMTCSACGASDLPLCDYVSMMVLRHDSALFAVRCPHCHAVSHQVCKIPGRLQGEIHHAARDIDAGMGRANTQQ